MNDDRAGTFWVGNGPRVPGTLSLEQRSYSLELEGYCFTPQNLEVHPGYITFSDDPAAIAADFAPRTILGELDAHGAVTLLDAHMDTSPFFLGPPTQTFHGSYHVLGTYIDGHEHPIHGIRWTWNFSSAQAGWLNDPPSAVTEGPLRGALKPWTLEDRPGLEVQLSDPAELRVVRQGVMTAITQFLVLWTGCPIDLSHVEIQLDDGNWYKCSPPPSDAGKFSRTKLLPLNEITLQHLARWLPMAFKLDPLPYIASATAGVLQIDAQAVATSLEGLHRRLLGERRPFAPLSNGAVKRATRAAREAGVRDLAVSGFEDETLAGRLFSEALNHIDQPSYQQRVAELAAPVVGMAPGLCGPDLISWVRTMKNIRNDQSHQLLDRFYDEEVTQYHIASLSGRWVLKLRILIEFVDAVRLSSALRESQSFAFTLANMDVEHYWKGFSCLQTFRQGGEYASTAGTG